MIRMYIIWFYIKYFFLSYTWKLDSEHAKNLGQTENGDRKICTKEQRYYAHIISSKQELALQNGNKAHFAMNLKW